MYNFETDTVKTLKLMTRNLEGLTGQRKLLGVNFF